MNLSEHTAARCRRIVQQRKVLAPDVRNPAPAEYPERNGTATLDRELTQAGMVAAQTGIVGRAIDAFAGELDDSGVEIAHYARESSHFVPARNAACYGPIIGRFMAR